jgi:hypothetical protein
MARIFSCLRFLLFWLLPYAAAIVFIWYGGVYVDAILGRFRVGLVPRYIMIAAVTCWWLTALGVTWGSRHPHAEFPPRLARDRTPVR